MTEKKWKKLESLVDPAIQNRSVASVNISSKATKMRNTTALAMVTLRSLAASQTYCYAVNVIRKPVPARTDHKRLAPILVDTSRNVSTIDFRNQELPARTKARFICLLLGRYITIKSIAVNLLHLGRCIVIKSIEEPGPRNTNRSLIEGTMKTETWSRTMTVLSAKFVMETVMLFNANIAIFLAKVI